ncbi:unnamed protein product [Dibothriocephalus latus]|uniref:Dynein light chain n=1 Tax=Dibothriocephalus latus TaxID=60516 RepID=A0A3P7LHV7_DIBLA|nr:unnamed protein product [Dibothriocephalus latus]
MADTMKFLIRSTDMTVEMQESAAKVAISAVSKFEVEKDMAAFVKKEFDGLHGETWHCIVGKDYGSYVTHVEGGFIYFYLDKLAFQLYKTA